MARGKARVVVGMENQTERHARRIVSHLIREGLVHSEASRAPLKIDFPAKFLRYYFPDIFDSSVPGEK